MNYIKKDLHVKQFFLTLLVMCTYFYTQQIHAQNYENRWKRIEKAIQEDLPQQQITEANVLMKKARSHGDFAWEMAAWTVKINALRSISPDSIKSLKPPTYKKTPTNQAVVDALTGVGDKQDSILLRVLQNKQALFDAKATQFLPLLTQGEDSWLYGNDMLSVMTTFIMQHSNLSHDKKADIYNEVASFYRQHNNDEAYTLMRLAELNERHTSNTHSLRLTDNDYRAEIKALLHISTNLDAGADVAQTYMELLDNDNERLTFARWASRQFPKHNAAFENAIRSVTLPSCDLTFSNTYTEGTPLHYTIRYTNLEQVLFEVRLYNGEDKNGNLRKDGKLILQRNYTCGPTYNEETTRLEDISGTLCDSIVLAPQRYVFIVQSAGNTIVRHQDLSSLSLFAMRIHDGQILCRVLNSRTGEAVNNAIVECTIAKKTYTYPTDEVGEVIITPPTDAKNQRIWLYAHTQPSNRTADASLWNITDEGRETRDEGRVTTKYNMFLDRPVYRPGQTINLAVLAYDQNEDNLCVKQNFPITIIMKDVEDKEISRQTITTNGMGSANGTFSIPEGIKTGTWRIDIDGCGYSHRFRVEEYKRPTFYVETMVNDADDTQYSIGDSISVRVIAKSFSGLPIQNATVSYKIETTVNSFLYYLRNNWSTLTTGTVTTNENGEAFISMVLDSLRYNDDRDNIVRYKLNANVTDLSGETEQGSYSVNISSQGFHLTLNADDIIDLSDSTRIRIIATNAGGKKVVVSGEYIVECASKIVARGIFDAQSPFVVLNPKTMSPGNYTITLNATDKNGKGVTTNKDVKLFTSQQPLIRTCFSDVFIYQTTNEFDESHPGKIYFSPQQDHTPLYLLITSGNNIVEERELLTDRKLYQITFPYKKEYGDGVTIRLYGVRDGKILFSKHTITLRHPDKDLHLSWKTFRDRLVPGAQNHWTLNVRSKTGKAISGAEMIATLYDAALNEICRDDWHLSTSFPRNIHNFASIYSATNKMPPLRLSTSMKYLDVKSRSFTTLSQYIYPDYYHGSAFDMLPLSHLKFSNRAMLCTTNNLTAQAEATTLTGETTQDTPSIRSNFCETALFSPSIISNKNGEIDVQFTLPESLTQWQFMGVVHTTDMQHGSIQATATAQQQFMVQPNMPRFLREEDETLLATRIFNNSDQDLYGVISLRIREVTTTDTIDLCTTNDAQPFSIKCGQSTSIFLQMPTLRAGTYIVDVVGKTDTFSDGERHELIVLPTDTTDETTGTLPAITNPHNMVFEALETMNVPQYDNSPSLATAIYVNTTLKKYKQQTDADSLISQAKTKLTSLQNTDGSWSWFKGMEGNRLITIAVCEQLVLLHPSTDTDDLLNKALNYLDQEEINIYKQRKQNQNKKANLSPDETTLHYLHLYTLLPDRTMQKELKSICQEYMKALEKDSGSLSIYGKANASLLLNHFNHKKSACTFLQSVMEYSVYKSGMGRYFDTHKAQYSWMDYRIPTQLAAMNAIETLHTTSINLKEKGESRSDIIKDMFLWLLRQKQVQKWDNPVNTIKIAEYALGRDNIANTSLSDTTQYNASDLTEITNQLTISTHTSPTSTTALSVGKQMTLHAHIRNELDMDFVRVKINHAACMEPTEQISGCRVVDGHLVYVAHHDSYTELFFEQMRKGDHDINLNFFITTPGTYSLGSSEVQCMYCTDFRATTPSQSISIKNKQ